MAAGLSPLTCWPGHPWVTETCARLSRHSLRTAGRPDATRLPSCVQLRTLESRVLPRPGCHPQKVGSWLGSWVQNAAEQSVHSVHFRLLVQFKLLTLGFCHSSLHFSWCPTTVAKALRPVSGRRGWASSPAGFMLTTSAQGRRAEPTEATAGSQGYSRNGQKGLFAAVELQQGPVGASSHPARVGTQGGWLLMLRWSA